MKLHTRILGEGKDLIILHGLYGAGDNWLSAGRLLSENYRVHLPDQRNHGNSPHNPSHTYKDMVNDLVEYISENHVEAPIVIGHSMGGKTAMWLSVLYPEIPSAMVIVDISPVGYARISSPSPLISQHLNIINAMRQVDLSSVKNRNDIDREFSAYIPFDRVRQFLIKSIDRKREGGYQWKLNIDAISNNLPEIMGGIDIEKYVEKIKPQLPVLFIKGELSGYIPDEDLDAIKMLYPKASIETIFDSGHWVHAEKPEAFQGVLNHFLDTIK